LRDNKGGGEGKRRGKAGVEGEDRWGRKSGNERENGKRGQKEVRATSRTICPGWPRRGGKEGRKIEEERKQK